MFSEHGRVSVCVCGVWYVYMQHGVYRCVCVVKYVVCVHVDVVVCVEGREALVT